MQSKIIDSPAERGTLDGSLQMTLGLSRMSSNSQLGSVAIMEELNPNIGAQMDAFSANWERVKIESDNASVNDSMRRSSNFEARNSSAGKPRIGMSFGRKANKKDASCSHQTGGLGSIVNRYLT